MTDSKSRGSRLVRRSLSVLTALPIAGVRGWRLSDLAKYCALDTGTTHRILQDFLEHRLALQHPSTRRYVLGPLASELAASFPATAESVPQIRESLKLIAQETGASAFYSVRSGGEFVVIHTYGPKISRSVMELNGLRRPLVWTTSGVAILLALPPQAREEAIALGFQQMAVYQKSRLKACKQLVADSKKHKRAINIGVTVALVNSYSVPILRGAEPVASITLIGHSERLPQKNTAKYFNLLDRAAATVSLEADFP